MKKNKKEKNFLKNIKIIKQLILIIKLYENLIKSYLVIFLKSLIKYSFPGWIWYNMINSDQICSSHANMIWQHQIEFHKIW